MLLTKHHGLGNDFLVALDPPHALDGDAARAVCDRRTGIGADGLIVGTSSEPSMVLFNADGSRAEMSGNGIRCLAQAIAHHRREGDFVIATDAGPKAVQVRRGSDDRTVDVRVDMGPVTETDVPDLGLAAKDVLGASVGNPHVVALFADRAGLDAAADGFDRIDRNVEFVMAGPGEGELTMRVVERGVGETQACGTGACAAAWAARRWGIGGDEITVHMPGGSSIVELGDGTVHLRGPAVYVATVEIPWP